VYSTIFFVRYLTGNSFWLNSSKGDWQWIRARCYIRSIKVL